jgi:predicted RNA-binding protein Jag
MPFFSAYERKKIHSIVGEYWNPKIYTKSVWEWNERRLFICKTDEKLTIDLDWSDI